MGNAPGKTDNWVAQTEQQLEESNLGSANSLVEQVNDSSGVSSGENISTENRLSKKRSERIGPIRSRRRSSLGAPAVSTQHDFAEELYCQQEEPFQTQSTLESKDNGEIKVSLQTLKVQNSSSINDDSHGIANLQDKIVIEDILRKTVETVCVSLKAETQVTNRCLEDRLLTKSQNETQNVKEVMQEVDSGHKNKHNREGKSSGSLHHATVNSVKQSCPVLGSSPGSAEPAEENSSNLVTCANDLHQPSGVVPTEGYQSGMAEESDSNESSQNINQSQNDHFLESEENTDVCIDHTSIETRYIPVKICENDRKLYPVNAKWKKLQDGVVVEKDVIACVTCLMQCVNIMEQSNFNIVSEYSEVCSCVFELIESVTRRTNESENENRIENFQNGNGLETICGPPFEIEPAISVNCVELFADDQCLDKHVSQLALLIINSALREAVNIVQNPVSGTAALTQSSPETRNCNTGRKQKEFNYQKMPVHCQDLFLHHMLSNINLVKETNLITSYFANSHAELLIKLPQIFVSDFQETNSVTTTLEDDRSEVTAKQQTTIDSTKVFHGDGKFETQSNSNDLDLAIDEKSQTDRTNEIDNTISGSFITAEKNTVLKVVEDKPQTDTHKESQAKLFVEESSNVSEEQFNDNESEHIIPATFEKNTVKTEDGALFHDVDIVCPVTDKAQVVPTKKADASVAVQTVESWPVESGVTFLDDSTLIHGEAVPQNHTSENKSDYCCDDNNLNLDFNSEKNVRENQLVERGINIYKRKELDSANKGMWATKTNAASVSSSSSYSSQPGLLNATRTDGYAEIITERSDLSMQDLKNSLNEMEEKYRRAMLQIAQLDNERTQLYYQSQQLQDLMEEQEEELYRLRKEHKRTCQEVEHQKQANSSLQKKYYDLQETLRQRDELIQEFNNVQKLRHTGERDILELKETIEWKDKKIEALNRMLNLKKKNNLSNNMSNEQGLVLVGDDNSSSQSSEVGAGMALVSPEVAELLDAVGEGPLDARLRNLVDDKHKLEEQVKRLQNEIYEERQERAMHTSVHSGVEIAENGLNEMQLLEVQREANKQVNEYKLKLQKSEQELAAFHGNVTRLESQLQRYKQTSEIYEKNEDEMRAEKRKLMRDLRTALDRIEEMEMTNSHLEKRLERIRASRTAISSQS
uniref:Thyroid receptor-interacting protein 11 n=1 Tax=Phallusia mammillata TaxID=59560 RepID=A0A6F9DW71_9ASCI|nr:thyroid receptor-interacting protein 11 [Phallusia mammillata]